MDKLKAQMAAKKEEHDAMEKLTEKDLWCKDLDDFANEWEVQLREEEDYQKTIRNTNRRASRKIGAGKGAGKGRAKAADTEYNPKPSKPLKPNPAKGVIKVENKPHQRFLNMFTNKPKPKARSTSIGTDGAEDDEFHEVSDGLSDGDFDALKAAKPTAKESKESSRAPSEQPANGRAKRVAAAAPKKWIISDDEESESDDGKFLGDVGAMVKGIGGGDNSDTAAANGRVSLFAMQRPGSSHGKSTSTDLPKLKSKPSRNFDLSDDGDETNYEMLARSSPQKAPPPKDNLDSFLSDDDDVLIPVTKKVPTKAAAPKAAPKAATKSAPKPKKAPAPKKTADPPKPTQLSPAAKAYAAKQNKMKLTSKKIFSEDEDEDEDVEMDDVDSPPPQPAARGRGRPARAATVAKAKKPVYIDSDDDDEMDIDDNDESALVEEQSEDDFDDSD